MFMNGDIHREYTTVSPLSTPIFPTKVATVKILQSSTHQCSSYSGHTHLELLDRVIRPEHSNPEVLNIQLEHDCAEKTSSLHPSDLHWSAYESLPGFSAIATLR